MKLLVTGAAGFLGRNVVDYLRGQRPEVDLVTTDVATMPADRLQRAWHMLDVRDQTACVALLQQVRPTHVLHAAAVTLTDGTAESERMTREVNLDGTAHMLDACEAAGTVQRFLLVSSGAVYGHTAATAASSCASQETQTLRPSGSYASAKQKAEQLLLSRASAIGCSGISARVGPVYGPHETPTRTRPRVSLVQQLVDATRVGRPLRVAGADFARDWTHAEDVAAALVLLLEAPLLREPAYNVSTGVPVSARELLALFEELGLEVVWQRDEAGADLVLDPSAGRAALPIARLQQDTAFRPRYNLRHGIADVLAKSCGKEKSGRSSA